MLLGSAPSLYLFAILFSDPNNTFFIWPLRHQVDRRLVSIGDDEDVSAIDLDLYAVDLLSLKALARLAHHPHELPLACWVNPDH